MPANRSQVGLHNTDSSPASPTKETFANLYFDWAVPYTCEELLTGELEPVEVKLEDDCDGYAGMFTGKITTNYHLVSVTLKTTDSSGNVVLDKPYFVDVARNVDYGNRYYKARVFNTDFDMADLGIFVTNAGLQPGESYSYCVTVDLATDDHVVVKEGNFAFGS